MRERARPPALIPLFLDRTETHWHSKPGREIMHSFLKDAVDWQLFGEVTAVSDNESLLDLAREIGARAVHASTPADDVPLSMEWLAGLAEGLTDAADTPVVLLDFRLQGVSREVVEQALSLHAQKNEAVVGMVECEDHPCQIRYCERLVDVGSLYRLDRAYPAELPGRIATKEFRLPPGIFPEVVTPGTVAMVECDPVHSVFRLEPGSPDPNDAVAWRITREGFARLLIAKRLTEGEDDAIVGVAVAETGQAQCILVETPAGERLRLTTDKPEALFHIWTREGDEPPTILFRSPDGSFNFSNMPKARAYDFALYIPALDAVADWVLPLSTDNRLWHQDPVTLKAFRKDDGSAIFGRQAFPDVFEPKGLAVFTAGEGARLPELLREGEARFLELSSTETTSVTSMLDILRLFSRKHLP